MKNYQNTNYTNAITKTSPSPGPLSPGGASAIRTPLAVCPLFPATSLRGPEHRSRRVPSPANICGGFWLFTSGGGARAPRPDGGGPPGRSLDSTSYLLGRERSLWATRTLGPSRFQCPREPLS